jgi:hypothetical protein
MLQSDLDTLRKERELRKQQLEAKSKQRKVSIYGQQPDHEAHTSDSFQLTQTEKPNVRQEDKKDDIKDYKRYSNRTARDSFR